MATVNVHEVKQGIYDALKADGTLMGVITAVHEKQAPPEAVAPYVVHRLHAPATEDHTFADELLTALFAVEVVDAGHDAKRAWTQQERIKVVLTAGFDVDGQTLIQCLRISVHDFEETLDEDRVFQHVVGLYRCWVQ